MRSESVDINEYLDYGDGGVASISLSGDMDDVDDTANDIITSGQTITRMVDLSAALEELAEIAGDIQSATPTEIRLINNNIAMAVVGSDLTPQEIEPALESRIGHHVSLEGVGSFIKSIWNGIVGLITRILNSIRQFFSKLLGRSARTEARTRKLIKIAESKMSAQPMRRIIDFSKEDAIKITISGKVALGTVDLLNGVEHTNTLLKDIRSKYLIEIRGVGEALAKAIDAFDETQPDISVERVVKAIEPISIHTGGLDLKKLGLDKRYTGTVMVGYPLMGNVRVVAKLPLVDDNSTDMVHRSTIARSTSYTVEEDVPGFAPHGAISFHAPMASDCIKVLTELERVINDTKHACIEIDKSVSHGGIAANVKKAGEHLSTRLASKEAHLDPRAKSAYQTTVKFNAAFVNWAETFMTRCMSTIENANQATLAAVERCLDNLK